jgi:hypothetical protein
MSDSPFPDKDLSREGWLDIVKPVDMLGRLDHIPARKPRSKKEKEMARVQNYWLSRRSIGGSNDAYRTGYDRIKWNHDTEPNAASD